MKKFILIFLLLCSTAFAQDDIDIFGGWTGLQSTTTYHVTGNDAESVTGMILTDTGAFAGKTLTNKIVQPDASEYMYFIINGNDDDNLYIEPCDRLDYDVITNGDMELDASWGDHNTPTTNEQSGTSVVGDYSWHVVGDAADDGVQQTGLTIQDDRVGHNESFYGTYKSIGLIKVDSGTVYMSISDNNGSIYDAQVGTTAGGVWEDFETGFFSSTYEGVGTGTIEFYCSGGACEFYIDEIVVGEYDYGVNNVYVGMDDYNTGTQEYAIYGDWRVEQIENRWWIIDPLDNVFFIKGINNVDVTTGAGYDFDGNTLCTNMTAKYGEPTSSQCGRHTVERLQTFKDYGFNTLGSILSGYLTPDDLDLSTYPLIPYITQVRVTAWNFSDVGEIAMRGTNYDSKYPDTYDADWNGKFNDYPNGVFGDTYSWGFGTDNVGLTTNDVTPYQSMYLNAAANPYYIGWDLDEEPPGTGSGYGHMGYYLFCSQVGDSDADDGVNDTVIAFTNALRAKYTAGSEAAFVANIGYGGSDEITTVASWSGVTGYVDAAADAAALVILNAAWGTVYTTWANVLAEDGVDASGTGEDANFEVQSDCSGTSTSCHVHDGSPNANLLSDLDELQGNYFRKYMYPFYTHLFSTTGYFRGLKLDFGPGVSHFAGWAKGSISNDGLTKYMDVFYTHGIGGSGGGFSGLDQAPFPTVATQASFKELYDINNIPVVHESVWVTAEADTMFGFKGVVDAVYKLVDVDYAVYRGEYDGFSGTQIADDAAITWNSGTYTGTLFWQFENSTDTPTNESSANYGDKYIIIADSGSIGHLVDNDIVTDGTNTFTIAGTPTRTSMLVDADANFDTDYDNPKALNNTYYWFVIVDLDDPSPVRYYMTHFDYTTERSVVCYKDFQAGDSYGVPGSYEDVNVGDNYYLTYLWQDGNVWREEHYTLQKQEDRANLYTSILKQTFENGKGTDGNYFDMGLHNWSAWDYGFGTYKTIEIRNFGFFSRKDNAYDGIEATTKGADGIAGNADDEEGDYGDFVNPMKAYLTNIYQELQPKTKSNGFSINGATFN